MTQTLSYKSVKTTDNGATLTVTPLFKCPEHGYESASVTVAKDSNGLALFTLPCGRSFQLYLAVHEGALSLSTEPINMDWWIP